MNSKYLFGLCAEYAAALKNKENALTIECVFVNKKEAMGGGLVHAYCRNKNGDYIDCRGITPKTEKESFFSVFMYSNLILGKDLRPYEKDCNLLVERFSSVEAFSNRLYNYFKNGTVYYDEEEDIEYTVPYEFHNGKFVEL